MEIKNAAPLTGWRVGDAGFTIFGPKVEGAPAPRIILAGKDRAAVRLAAAAPELLAALEYVSKIIPAARNYFPKSVQNSDRFQLENACATVGAAIHAAKGASHDA